MNLEILPATEAHARELIRSLRDADRAEIIAAGARPGRAVLASWRDAVIRRAALIDGEVAALWGVNGSLLGGGGVPWFLTGAPFERAPPLRFARIYRAEVASMLRLFVRLENYVDATYSSAIRMLILAGFHLDDPMPYGPHGALFHRFEMRAR